jgi:small GTP-binding protein
MSFDFSYKCIIVGNSGVGKTSIMTKSIDSDSQIPRSHSITIGAEFGIKVLKIGDKTIKIFIWDTAGQERFRSITRAYYREATTCILVFDICDQESFDSLHQWVKDVNEINEIKPLMLLVGNKSDQEDKRKVSKSDALRFAVENEMNYIETSAMNGTNVSEPFHLITDRLIRSMKHIKTHNNEKINQMFNGIRMGSDHEIEYLTNESKSKSNTNTSECC